MSAELVIGTLRLPGDPGHVDAFATVRALDLSPRTDDRTVLIVRRLEVRQHDAAGARERLAALRRTAARPARGPVDARAEAVEFADEAELLMCMSDDLAHGRLASRWWWDSRRLGQPSTPGDALAALWLRQPRLVPAVLAALAAPDEGRAVRALEVLGPAAARLVLQGVLAEFAPDLAAAGATPAVSSLGPWSPGRRADAARMDDTRADDGAATIRAWLPTTGHAVSSQLPPVSYALLVSGIVLAERAGRASSPQFVAWLSDQLGGAPSPTGQPAPPPGAAAWPPGRPASAPDALSRPAQGAREPSHVTPLRREQRGRGGPPANQVSDAPPWQHRPWEGSGPGTRTELASMLYAVNLVTRFGLGQAAETSTGWAVVEAVCRWLLRGLPQARRRALLKDPLFPLLAELDGRPPERPIRVPLGAALRPVRRFLDDNEVTAQAFVRPGTLVVSRTHVDVVMTIAQVDLAARACGLDQDPGWVPNLGRVVLFHFEGTA